MITVDKHEMCVSYHRYTTYLKTQRARQTTTAQNHTYKSVSQRLFVYEINIIFQTT